MRLFRGDAPDLDAECGDYERTLASLGGIDLCVLGLGENGHIAFNEPGSAWNSRTHVVDLSVSTRASIEADASGPRPVPTHGLTLGIQNVLEARQALLLIAGPRKLAAKVALCARRRGSRLARDQSSAASERDRHRALTSPAACR